MTFLMMPSMSLLREMESMEATRSKLSWSWTVVAYITSSLSVCEMFMMLS